MVRSFDGFNYLLRLNKGERLTEAILSFMRDTKIQGAWVNGIGGTLKVELGFYDIETKQYKWQTFEGLREIASLQGNIAYKKEDGEPMVHLHGVFSDHRFQTIGGHVKDLVAGATVELFIHRSYKPMHRAFSDEIGLPLLDL